MELHPMSHLLLEGEPADQIDAWSEDGGAYRHGSKRGGDDSAHQLLRLGLWLCFIFAGYTVARLGCYVGLPEDGTTNADAFDLFDDVSKMFQAGFVLAVFLRVMNSVRFAFLFRTSAWYFIPTFLCTPPVYSLIRLLMERMRVRSNIPAFQHSLADISRWGWGMWALELGAVSAALTSIGWHARAAWCRKSRRDFIAYVSSRAAVILFYVGAAAMLSLTGSHYSALHVHHLYLGFAIAMWAEFDHPVSVVTLALGLGIFVQGIGAFSFASNFEDPACFTTRPATRLKCHFEGDLPYSIHVCPANGGIYREHYCTAKP